MNKIKSTISKNEEPNKKQYMIAIVILEVLILYFSISPASLQVSSSKIPNAMLIELAGFIGTNGFLVIYLFFVGLLWLFTKKLPSKIWMTSFIIVLVTAIINFSRNL